MRLSYIKLFVPPPFLSFPRQQCRRSSAGRIQRILRDRDGLHQEEERAASEVGGRSRIPAHG